MSLSLPRARWTVSLLTMLSALALSGCDQQAGLTDPDAIPPGQADLLVYMALSTTTTIVGLTVEITASDLAAPIIANIPVVGGVGEGTVRIPAGSDRRVVIRAFNADGIETHRGETTIDVAEGATPTVEITLEPVFDDVPIHVSMGSWVLTLEPANAVLRVGDPVLLTAVLRDGLGNVVTRTITYGSTNPVVASVDDAGVVTPSVVGQTEIVASFGDVQDVATITVTEFEWAALHVGERHTCGLDQDGAAFCWGSNFAGQLGDGTTTIRLSPVPVTGGHTFVSLTAGGLQTCGITGTGEAWCWGRGAVLGDANPSAFETAPVMVAGGHTWQTVEMGIFHACGITTGGETYCWGSGGNGRLGNGSTTAVDEPTLVSGGHSFTQVSAGRNHTCAINTTDDGFCWGLNSTGQLGDDTRTNSQVPVQLFGSRKFVTISAGGQHSCGVTVSGEGRCWGLGTQGQIGYGGQGSPRRPWPILGGSDWVSIDAGAFHTCGVKTSNEAFCWGLGAEGQIGDGTQQFFQPIPQLVLGGLSFVSVEASGSPFSIGFSPSQGYSCGRTVNSGAFCWGSNARGHLGDGTTMSRTLPTPVNKP